MGAVAEDERGSAAGAMRLRGLEARAAAHGSRLSAVLKEDEDGSIVVGPRGEVRFLSPAAEELLGGTVRDVVREVLALPVVAGEVVEIDLDRAPGDRRIAEIRVVDTRWNGEPARLAMVRDVTAVRTGAQSRDEARIAALVACAGAELSAAAGGQAIVERLCELASELLPCAASQTFLWSPESEAFVPSAFAGDADIWALAARVPKLPRWRVQTLLRRLADDDVAMLDADNRLDPALTRLAQTLNSPEMLLVALRRRGQIVGFQAMIADPQAEPFGPSERRVAAGLARAASAALESARRVEELELLQRARAEFLSTMSHELRAPLHVVLGYQSLLLEGDFGALNPDQADALQRIGKGARQLLELVENTLNMNRIQAGRLPLELCDVPAADLVREVEAETKEQCDASGLAFTWELEDDLPALRTDPTKLKIALKNLIGNAIKYTDQGGVTVTARPRGGGAEIAVADTGRGIEPSLLRSIFEPFKQIKDGAAPDRGGVGLGLYIVQRMLDMMGGTVSVESKPGVGSVFKIWAPGVKR